MKEKRIADIFIADYTNHELTKGASMAWYGNSSGHAAAGRKGGKAQGKKNNPGNFANDPEKAKRAGRKGGSTRKNE